MSTAPTPDPYGRSDWRNPYGEYGHDPYSQYVRFGRDPYAHYAQGHVPYQQYRLPSAIVPATAALMANIIVAVVCCGVGLMWLPGILLARRALKRAGVNPVSARRLAAASCVCLLADIALTLVIVVVYRPFAAAH